MGFLSGLFKPGRPTSREVARERLQLVLVHDRTQISPAMLEKLKDELITVISRYVEIDADGVEVTFSGGKRQNRLVADIPVVGPLVKRSSKKAAAKKGAGRDGTTRLAEL